MMKVRTLTALVAVAALPACSMFGGGSHGSPQASTPPPPAAAQPAPAAQVAQTEELTPDLTRQVQTKLQQGGLYHGRIDGVWGPATQAAVRSYQQQNNINPTGQIDQQTMAALDIAPSANGTNTGQPTPPPPPPGQQQSQTSPSSNSSGAGNYNPPPNAPPPNAPSANGTNQPGATGHP